MAKYYKILHSSSFLLNRVAGSKCSPDPNKVGFNTPYWVYVDVYAFADNCNVFWCIRTKIQAKIWMSVNPIRFVKSFVFLGLFGHKYEISPKIFCCLLLLNKFFNGNVSVLHQNSGVIGKSIPDAQEISWDPRDFPREISRVSGNLLGAGDGFPNSQ